VAERICLLLEQRGLSPWIASRDITPGVSWAEGIIDAINNCQVLVLVLSQKANDSPHVQREVERAVSKGVRIVPIKLGSVVLSKHMEYLVSAQHWLEASNPPSDAHLARLADSVERLLRGSGPETPQADIGPRHARPRRRVRTGLLLACAAGLAAVVALLLISSKRPQAAETMGGAGIPQGDVALRDGASDVLFEAYEPSGLRLELWTDRGHEPQFAAGETVRVFLKASEDCLAYIMDIGADTSSIKGLTPSQPDHPLHAKAGNTYRIPDATDQGWTLEVRPPFGTETIRVFACRLPLPLDSLFAVPGTLRDRILGLRAFVATLPTPTPYAERSIRVRLVATRG